MVLAYRQQRHRDTYTTIHSRIQRRRFLLESIAQITTSNFTYFVERKTSVPTENAQSERVIFYLNRSNYSIFRIIKFDFKNWIFLRKYAFVTIENRLRMNTKSEFTYWRAHIEHRISDLFVYTSPPCRRSKCQWCGARSHCIQTVTFLRFFLCFSRCCVVAAAVIVSVAAVVVAVVVVIIIMTK